MASYKKLGERIKKLRKEKGLTQEELAELAKVDPKSIIQIEAGKRNSTIKTVNKIAVALKTSVAKLLS